MKRSVFLTMFFAIGFLMTMAQDYTRYVDPRIGSEGLGRTFPGLVCLMVWRSRDRMP